MNTNRTFTRSILGRSLAVAVLGLAALAATPARADAVPTKVVQLADLNLASEAGRIALVRRLSSAAASVCGDRDDRNLANDDRIRICRRNAMDGAIAQLNEPALTAWFAARYGHSPATQVASAK